HVAWHRERAVGLSRQIRAGSCELGSDESAQTSCRVRAVYSASSDSRVSSSARLRSSEGSMSLSDDSQFPYCRGKQVLSRLGTIDTAVEAPGEAPSRVANEPSAEDTSSVPKAKTPPLLGSFFITCTRWPAWMNSQSAGSTCGMNS